MGGQAQSRSRARGTSCPWLPGGALRRLPAACLHPSLMTQGCRPGGLLLRAGWQLPPSLTAAWDPLGSLTLVSAWRLGGTLMLARSDQPPGQVPEECFLGGTASVEIKQALWGNRGEGLPLCHLAAVDLSPHTPSVAGLLGKRFRPLGPQGGVSLATGKRAWEGLAGPRVRRVGWLQPCG